MSSVKLSWGTGIVIAFIAFVGFILFFVVRMTISSQSNHDLVTPNYYQEELHFQEDMAAQKRAKDLDNPPKINTSQEGILISFPSEMTKQPKSIQGNVYLFKPDNKKLDQNFMIEINNNQMFIPASKLVSGRWNLIIDWQFEKSTYRLEQGVNLPINF